MLQNTRSTTRSVCVPYQRPESQLRTETKGKDDGRDEGRRFNLAINPTFIGFMPVAELFIGFVCGCHRHCSSMWKIQIIFKTQILCNKRNQTSIPTNPINATIKPDELPLAAAAAVTGRSDVVGTGTGTDVFNEPVTAPLAVTVAAPVPTTVAVATP